MELDLTSLLELEDHVKSLDESVGISPETYKEIMEKIEERRIQIKGRKGQSSISISAVRKTGRAFNGAHRDAGKIIHLINEEEPHGDWFGKAICGTEPGIRGNGWHKEDLLTASCDKCVKKLIKKHIQENPEVQWGAPTIIGTRILTETMSGMILAGETVESLASIYELTEEQVLAAVLYETQ